MKKIVMISIAIFAILVLFACSYKENIDEGYSNGIRGSEIYSNEDHSGEEAGNEQQRMPALTVFPDSLRFSSLEDFLNSYVAVKNGGIARGEFDFPGEWMPSSAAVSDVIESVEFTALDTLYFPIGLPEDFLLHRIRVTDVAVSFEYLHKDDMNLDAAARNKVSSNRTFFFFYTRWDMDHSFLVDAMLSQSFLAPGVNATEDDLINGKYFYNGRYSFTWIHDRERFTLRMPTQIDIGMETTVDEHGLTVFTNPADMVKFLEIRTVDLTDPEQIEALLRELAPPEFYCDYCEDVGCAECNPPEFNCEYCEDEGCEVCELTHAIFYLAADAVTISNTNRHVSVFVGETATAVGEITLNLLDDIPELVVTVRDNLWTPTGPVEGIVIGVAGNASISESRIVELEVTRQGVTVVISIELIAN